MQELSATAPPNDSPTIIARLGGDAIDDRTKIAGQDLRLSASSRRHKSRLGRPGSVAALLVEQLSTAVHTRNEHDSRASQSSDANNALHHLQS